MTQSITQIKRNLVGYQMVNQFGLGIITSKTLEEMKQRGKIGRDIEVIKVSKEQKEVNYLVYNKKELENFGVMILRVEVEYIEELDRDILKVDYENVKGLTQAQYVVDRVLETEENNYYRILLIEEE